MTATRDPTTGSMLFIGIEVTPRYNHYLAFGIDEPLITCDLAWVFPTRTNRRSPRSSTSTGSGAREGSVSLPTPTTKAR